MKRMSLPTIILAILCLTLFVGCQQMEVESEQPITIETPTVSADDDKPTDDFGLTVSVGSSLPNQTVEPDEPIPQHDFAIKKITSHGFVFSGKVTHDHLKLTVDAGIDLTQLQIHSEVNNQKRIHRYDEALACTPQALAAVRNLGRFAMTTDTHNQTILCIPSPVTLVRNELYLMDFYFEDELISEQAIQYPGHFQQTDYDFTSQLQ